LELKKLKPKQQKQGTWEHHDLN